MQRSAVIQAAVIGVMATTAVMPGARAQTAQDANGPVAVPPTTDAPAAPQPAAAEEKLDLGLMLGSVSAASRQEESVFKAPATVTVITAEDIRYSGATTLTELLRRVPGIQVIHNGPGDDVVSLRGTAGLLGNNVVVTVNGVPLNSPVDGSVDWAGVPVPLFEIETIEVVRGPVSTIYGANAYTGVIAISTTAIPAEDFKVAAHLGGGMDDRGQLGGTAALRLAGNSRRLAWAVAPFVTYDRRSAVSPDEHFVQPALIVFGGTGTARLSLSDDAILAMELGGGTNHRTSLDHLVLEAHDVRSTSSYLSLRYDVRNLSSVLKMLTVWGRGRQLAQDSNPAAYKGFFYNNVRNLDGNVGFDAALSLPAKVAVNLGANAGLSKLSAPFMHPRENNKLRSNFGVYANASVDLADRLLLALGLRGDVSALTSNFALSYRASATYYGSDASLRLTVGSAFRNRTSIEVGGRFVDPATSLIFLEGNPLITEPRIDSAELAVILAPTPALSIRPTLYAARLTDLIVEDFEPIVRKTFANDPQDRKILGLELELLWHMSDTLTLLANGALLYWVAPPARDVASIGNPGMNSMLTAWLALRDSFLIDQLRLSVGGGVLTSRAYTVRAGIPPQVLVAAVPVVGVAELAGHYKLNEGWPLWAYLKGQAFFPSRTSESPLRAAAYLATTLFVGIEYQP